MDLTVPASAAPQPDARAVGPAYVPARTRPGIRWIETCFHLAGIEITVAVTVERETCPRAERHEHGAEFIAERGRSDDFSESGRGFAMTI